MDFTDPTSVNFNHPGNFTLPGQIAIGTGNPAPAQQIAVGQITGSGGITITNGSGTINVDGSGVVGTLTFTEDSGTAAPSGGVIHISGGNNISTSGATNVVTINVAGTTQHAIQIGNATNSLTSLGVASNGQIPIGSSGADPVLATITAGSGISVTNGAGSITIASTGGSSTPYQKEYLTYTFFGGF